MKAALAAFCIFVCMTAQADVEQLRTAVQAQIEQAHNDFTSAIKMDAALVNFLKQGKVPFDGNQVNFQRLSQSERPTAEDQTQLLKYGEILSQLQNKIARLADQHPDSDISILADKYNANLQSLAILHQGRLSYGDYASQVRAHEDQARRQFSQYAAAQTAGKAARDEKYQTDSAACQNETSVNAPRPNTLNWGKGLAGGAELYAKSAAPGIYYKNCMQARGWPMN